MSMLRWNFASEFAVLLEHHTAKSNKGAFRFYSSKSNITEDLVRKRILEDQSQTRLVEKLNRLSKKVKPATVGKNAGVLMPLCIVDDQLSLLYTLRAPWLRTHGGHVSFPGGKVDESDASVEEAALRETEEELGIAPNHVQIWTSMVPVNDRKRNFKVTPVLGYLGEIRLDELKFNTDEISDVFTVPITSLLKQEHQGYTQYRNGWRMPVIPNMKHNIWGLTAIATDVFLANAFPEMYRLVVSKDTRASWPEKQLAEQNCTKER